MPTYNTKINQDRQEQLYRLCTAQIIGAPFIVYSIYSWVGLRRKTYINNYRPIKDSLQLFSMPGSAVVHALVYCVYCLYDPWLTLWRCKQVLG